MKVALETLRKSIVRWTEKGELFTTAVPGLSLYRWDEPSEPISGMYEPSISMVAQGAKRVLLGDRIIVGRMRRIGLNGMSCRRFKRSHINDKAIVHVFFYGPIVSSVNAAGF